MFKFTVALRANEEGASGPISAYSRGDMTFAGPGGCVTTAGRQSLMIFYTLGSLLRAAVRLLAYEEKVCLNGLTYGQIFKICFIRKENKIVVKSDPESEDGKEECAIAEVRRIDFLGALLKGLQAFMEEAGDRLLEESDSDDIGEYMNMKWGVKHLSDALLDLEEQEAGNV